MAKPRTPTPPPPTPEEVATDPAARFVVKHSMVGQWPQGTELDADDLAGIDVVRLLELGAIEAI